MVTGDGALRNPLFVTCTDAKPSGAFEGMMAVTVLAIADTGIASIVVAPCVILTDTPLSEVSKGGEDGCARRAVPKFCPEMENSDPRAIAPPGRAGFLKLAAFTILCGVITGA